MIPLPKLDDSVKKAEYTPAMIDENTSIEAMDGKLYVIGDTSSTGFPHTVATAICFDPATRLWSKLPPLKTERYTMVRPELAALDGKLYVVGGYDDEMPSGGTGSALVDCFDPTVGDAGAWTRLPYMGTGRCHPGVAALDGMLYVVGGEPREDVPDESVECYDPSTDRWSYVTSLGGGPERWREMVSHEKTGVSLAAVGGKLYAIGGSETPYGSGKHVECFDPSAGNVAQYPYRSGEWSKLADMDTELGRENGAVAVLDM
jgi:N-acetylneuraminic acid mutarotase